MRNNRDNSIIEIDITNACHKTCSNCTRFCGHHKKPYFMDFETFKRAVDSLDGYQGLISTIGGEPLLHPDYSRFASYLQSKRDKEKLTTVLGNNAIINDYLGFAKFQRWAEASANAGRGYLLFTSIPKNYYKHFEDVQDTVSDLWLNDHTATSMHQPILASRKDLGIGDEEFFSLRDNCWLQNFWSGSITPKGGFFCEIAGTLDMLFDGPGGKPIESGWWNRDISEFKDQFHWCEMCGMALQTFSRDANDEVDDVTPSIYAKLNEMNSPKIAKKTINVFTAMTTEDESLGKDMASVMGNYLPDNTARVGGIQENLYPRNIKKVSSLGVALAQSIHNFDNREWILYCDDQVDLPSNFEELICSRVLNPGFLFKCSFGEGNAVLFSPVAQALKNMGFDGLRECTSIDSLISKWGDKVHVLRPGFDNEPDYDISVYSQSVFNNYNSDNEFKKNLRLQLETQNVQRGSKILVLQSAFIFHTLSIIRLIELLEYEVHVISSENFRDYFKDWIAPENITYFDDSHFTYDKQQKLRDKIKESGEFVGSIVPFSFGPSSIKPIDDYTNALKTAEDVGGRILGIINIRREFIEPEYNIWELN